MIRAVLSTLTFLGVAQSRMLLENRELSQKVGKETYCSTPIAKAKVNFPESIIGRAEPTFDMYSGYVNVTKEDWLFYWLFETADGNPDAPLIVWTNGGPGCSSMEGATTEHSPLVLYDIKEACSSSESTNCDYTGQLSINPYGWNAHANVLYLDQPRYVGYSFGYGEQCHSSVEAASDFITFYEGFLELFPDYVGKELIVSGESYGGHYVPAFCSAILSYNEDAAKPIKFAGAIIGNGCVNDTVQNTQQFINFQKEENLIPQDSNPKTQAQAEAIMIKHIGYVPNYYDYRVQSISCGACYGYNYTAWSYWFLQDEVETALNVCGDAGVDAFSGNAGGCISMGAFDALDDFDYSGALAQTLEAGIPVTFYYGKTDTACNYVGGYEMAKTISWTGRDGFDQAEMVDLEVAGVSVGQTKSYGGLTWIQVESAGHMVPLDQPAASSMAVNTIVEAYRRKNKKN